MSPSNKIPDIENIEEQENDTKLLLQSVLNTVGEAIISINHEGIIIVANQEAEKLWGYSHDNLIGKNLCDLMPEKYRDAHTKGMNRYMRDGNARVLNVRIELEALHISGQTFPIEILISESSFNKDRIFTAALRDISSRKRDEKVLFEAHRTEALGQLTGGIAHDFNNLISIITGNLRFLKEDLGDIDTDTRELLDDAISASNDAAELTEKLLTFSRNQNLITEIQGINRMVERMIPFLTRSLPPSVHLNTDLLQNEIYINVDVSHFENALHNLVINAYEAMSEGGYITIKIEAYHHDHASIGDSALTSEQDLYLDKGDYAVISITDTGRGIASEDLPRICEPFFTTKGIGEGSGLGLSMVQGFVKQSNGGYTVRSKLGKETAVSMYFPQVKSPVNN